MAHALWGTTPVVQLYELLGVWELDLHEHLRIGGGFPSFRGPVLPATGTGG